MKSVLTLILQPKGIIRRLFYSKASKIPINLLEIMNPSQNSTVYMKRSNEAEGQGKGHI